MFYDITKIKEIPDTSGKYATLMAQSTSAFGNLYSDRIQYDSQKVKQEFSVAEDVAELDAEYLAAVKQGDMETAQRMVDESAEKARAEGPSRGKSTIKREKVYKSLDAYSAVVREKKQAQSRDSYHTAAEK